MEKNRLLISAAGSGKTTYIVADALKHNGSVLITTYTEANEEEIKRKIIKEKKCIPSNITVQTWFSFLIQHGVKPYQGLLYDKDIKGLLLVNEPSGIKYKNAQGFGVQYAEETDFEDHYFSATQKIYSDKLSKLVIRCNTKSNNEVINRISRIYEHIYIDEVQDLAGYDLEILRLFFASQSKVTLVGDPRQVTYLTHHERKYSDYKDGKIEQFIVDKCSKYDVKINKETLRYSHRNNKELCEFSSKLYPQYPTTEACECPLCRNEKFDHEGVFLIKPQDLEKYMMTYKPTELHYSEAGEDGWNMGKSKGLGFDRVLIYPTKTMGKYLKDGQLEKTVKGKNSPAFDIPKFYVALTRARHSAAIVYDFSDSDMFIEGIKKFLPK